jgi:hypothetical protein
VLPALWTDPFGSLLKNVTVLAATLALLAIEDRMRKSASERFSLLPIFLGDGISAQRVGQPIIGSRAAGSPIHRYTMEPQACFSMGLAIPLP